jgi:hypothetical protein
MTAKETKVVTDTLYSLYREAALATLKELGLNDLETVQGLFLHNKRWSIMRQKDIETHVEPIKKLLEKGKLK